MNASHSRGGGCTPAGALFFRLEGMAWRGQRGQGKGWPGGAKGVKEGDGLEGPKGSRKKDGDGLEGPKGKGWPGGAKGTRKRMS